MKTSLVIGATLAVCLTGGAGTAAVPALAEAVCSPTVFVQASTYPAGDYPNAVAVGDFNNDGKLDVATGGNGLAVLLGHGDGSFDAPLFSPVTAFGRFLAAADFNGDGNVDLAIGDSSVQILLGNGNGTFVVGESYGTGGSTTGFVVADINGDGLPDLAEVSIFYSNSLFVLIGNGDGTFLGPAVYAVASPHALAAGDFNEDGRSDLAVALDDGTIALYFGNPDGSLSAPASVPVGSGMRALVAADLGGDGHSDLVVARDAYLDVLRGNGNGTFQAAIEYESPVATTGLIVADVDGDGRLDVAELQPSQSYASSRIAIVRQAPDGSLLPSGAFQAASATTPSFASGDFDGDGLPDFAVTSDQTDSVTVALAARGGTLRAVQSPAVNGQSNAVVISDFDGDGTLDVATLFSRYDTEVAVLARQANGAFAVEATTPVGNGSGGSLVTADFDADGRPDVAIGGAFDGSVIVLRGLGNLTFEFASSYDTGAPGSALAVGDFNGDGIPDLASAATFGQPGTLWLLQGNGDGTFQPPTLGPALSYGVTGIVAADLDGDGRPDLIVSNGACCIFTSDTVSVLRGNGDGTFQAAVEYEAGQSPTGLAVGDFNEDGILDAVVADGGAASVALLLGDGQGGFLPPILYASGSPGTAVVAADIDGDGHLDAALTDGGNTLYVMFGTGTGSFETPQSFATGSQPIALAAGRLWGGDAIGLAVANKSDDTVSIFENARLTAALPPTASVLVGSNTQMRVSASGYGVLSYQWRKGGVPIVGATGSTLTIDPAAFADAGSYDVLVTDSCTTVASNAATLSVEFADVPASNIFHGDIITIATAGVTAGCGGANYCPTGLVSRAQMAVFLLKSEHGSAYAPPTCTGMFADVPCPSPFANWIEQLANEGVTAGCGNGNYCPDATVTRAQMAIFLLKTSQGSGYAPPTAVGIFGDVPVGSFGADYIEDLYNRGITGGCSASPLLYCPNNTVNRGQMAAFLVNTFAP